MDQTPQLYSDILYEILSRTPLETLDRCKSLNKEFNDLAYDPQFLPLHASRTRTVSGYIVQYMGNSCRTDFLTDNNNNSSSTVEVSLNFLPRGAYVLASSNVGVLLCCSVGDNLRARYYICKPCTRQWMSLPNPKTRYTTKQVSLVVLKSNPLHYKIIRLSDPRLWALDKPISRCEIFDSKFWKWREAENMSLPCGVFTKDEGGVVVAASVYWLLNNYQVQEFDADKESWIIFNSPDEIMRETNCKNIKLVVYKGKLAIVCIYGFFFEWWVMRDCGKHIWEKKETFNIVSIEKRAPYPSCWSFFNAGVAIFEDLCGIIFYSFQDGVLKWRGLHHMEFSVSVFLSGLILNQFSSKRVWKRKSKDLEHVQVTEEGVGDCLDIFVEESIHV